MQCADRRLRVLGHRLRQLVGPPGWRVLVHFEAFFGLCTQIRLNALFADKLCHIDRHACLIREDGQQGMVTARIAFPGEPRTERQHADQFALPGPRCQHRHQQGIRTTARLKMWDSRSALQTFERVTAKHQRLIRGPGRQVTRVRQLEAIPFEQKHCAVTDMPQICEKVSNACMKSIFSR